MSFIKEPQERALFRDNVARLLEAEVAPHYEQWEKDGILYRHKSGALWVNRVCYVSICRKNLAAAVYRSIIP